jgi:hypothetical protein
MLYPIGDVYRRHNFSRSGPGLEWNALNKMGRDKPLAKITGRTERISVILSGSEGTAPLLFRYTRYHSARSDEPLEDQDDLLNRLL